MTSRKSRIPIVPEFGPLRDMKVIESCRYGACHLGTEILAEFGAQVIHIETPPFDGKGTDSYRLSEPLMGEKNTISAHGVQNGRNKLSIGLDFLNSDAGKDIFKELLKWADVYIEASRPGTMDRHGLGDDKLHEVNPALNIIHLSGYGQTGRLSSYPSHDLDIQAYSGFLSLIGYSSEPLRVPWVIADYATSVWLAFSAVAAYIGSRKDGIGDSIDLAQYEAFVRILDPYFCLKATYPDSKLPERNGNEHPDYFPYGVYRCADGWITVSAPFESTWKRLRRILNLPDDYDNDSIKKAHRDEITDILNAWLSNKKSKEVVAFLNENGVPSSKVNSVSDLLTDQHVKDRELIIEWEDENIGNVRGIGIIPKFKYNKGKIWRGFPRQGEDTDIILKHVVGISDDEIKHLRSRGVVN
ncbi:MAG: CoA transferase [Candidatus Micrarchaeia archaeon]